jgi:hypothetical protein
LGYSLPDIIDNTDDIRELINTIEADKELNTWTQGDDIRLPGSSDKKAKDIWAKLEKTPIGQKIIASHPDVKRYRISSTSTGGSGFAPDSYPPQREGDPDSTREIDAYDKWGNEKGQHLQNLGMPSFKEYITTNKWRNNEVSGGSSKETPVGVATQKQTPVK